MQVVGEADADFRTSGLAVPRCSPRGPRSVRPASERRLALARSEEQRGFLVQDACDRRFVEGDTSTIFEIIASLCAAEIRPASDMSALIHPSEQQL